MRAFVTGGTGFIGSAARAGCKDAGWQLCYRVLPGQTGAISQAS